MSKTKVDLLHEVISNWEEFIRTKDEKKYFQARNILRNLCPSLSHNHQNRISEILKYIGYYKIATDKELYYCTQLVKSIISEI